MKSLPCHMTLELTAKCNFRCPFCYCLWHEFPSLGAPELDTSGWKAVLDRCAESGVEDILFSGGEALLRPDLFTLLSYARRRMPSVQLSLFTNGRLLDEALIKRFKRRRVRIATSLPGLATYAAMTGARRTCHPILALVARADELGWPIAVSITVTRANLNEAADIFAAAALSRAESIQIGAVMAGGRALSHPELMLSRAEWEDVKGKIRALPDAGVPYSFCDEFFCECRADEPPPRLRRRWRDPNHSPCPAGRDFGVIGPTGVFRPCLHSLPDAVIRRCGDGRLAGGEGGRVTRLSLEAGQVAAIGDGWLQERYHSNGGDTVGDFLSFRSVYEINPFEVGTGHARERAECSARRGAVESLLEIAPLRRRPLMSLSNGEMRRVVLARCLLKESGTVVVDGGCGGFDPEWRGRLREVARAMRQFGVDLRVPDGGEPARRGGARKKGANSSAACHVAADVRDGTPIVEMRGVNVAFGRHVLFEDFSWTIREGERWILRGPNGSGKTTLFALITGDSPLAYACDVRVFGVRRGDEGAVLGDVRANIGEVSSVREAYLGVSAERQLDEALRPGVRLLLLDEPCCNMASGAANRFARRVVKWLKANRRAAAVWVEHRGERIPPEFSRVLSLAPVALCHKVKNVENGERYMPCVDI